jgi:hypothetical protein
VLVADGGQNFSTSQGPGRNAQTPVIGSKTVTFTAHCWGSANPTIPNDVYTQAEYLADAVLTALRLLVTAGNARISSEQWVDAGLAAGGVVLQRSFECNGVGIEQIKLPLDKPIELDASRLVIAVGPIGQTAPASDSGTSTTDASIGVTPYVPRT